MAILDSQKRPLYLGEAVGRGGEATVYRVKGRPNMLAKLYEPAPRPNYPDKLAWMVAHPPHDPNATSEHPSLAWPARLLYGGDGQLAGYLMTFIQGAVPAVDVFNPRRRARVLPGFDRRYLHRAARNLAAALGALHAAGYVVGDLNESNVLVTPSALVTLIDTDSFQVEEDKDGRRIVHPCPVGKLEYTPPELQGRSLAQTVRTPAGDAFGLGVLIFQLLMEGSHPFRAQWLGKGEPPPVEARIARGAFPYAAAPPLPVAPPRNAPDLAWLDPELAELFRRLFVDGSRDPDLRPTPAHWERAIATAERALLSCRSGHLYGGHLSGCPYCAAKRGGQERAAERRGGTGWWGRGAAGQAGGGAAGQAGGPTRPAAKPGGGQPAAAAGGGNTPRPGGAAGNRPPAQGGPAAGQPAGRGAAPGARPTFTFNTRWRWNPAGAGVGSASQPAPGAAQSSSRAPAAGQPAGSRPVQPTGGRAGTWGGSRGSRPAAASPQPRWQPGRPYAGRFPWPFSPVPNPQQPAAPYGRPSGTAGGPAASQRQFSWPFPGAAIPSPLFPLGGAPFRERFWKSVGTGGGLGALAGAVPAGLLGSFAYTQGFDPSPLLLWSLGGLLAGALRGLTPGRRLGALVDRTIGWRRFWQGTGMVGGALLGLILALPFALLILPLLLGLIGGGRLGWEAGGRIYTAGLRFGWERAWAGVSLVGAALFGAGAAALLALGPPGSLALEAGQALSPWLLAQSIPPILAAALAAAPSGLVGGLAAGFLADLSARVFRLID